MATRVHSSGTFSLRRRLGVLLTPLAVVLTALALVLTPLLLPPNQVPSASAATRSVTQTAGTGSWTYTVKSNPEVVPAAGGTVTYTFNFSNKTGATLWLDQADIAGVCDAATYKWTDGTSSWPRSATNRASVEMTCSQYWGPNATGKQKSDPKGLLGTRGAQTITVTPSRGAYYATSTNLTPLITTMPVWQPSSTPTATNALYGVSNGCTLGQFGITDTALSSVCWLATASWDPMIIGATTGTQTVRVPNADGTPSDWQLTYTVTFSGDDLKLTTSNSPTWEGSALGNGNFGGANIPSFYNTGTGSLSNFPQSIEKGTERVTLNNLVLSNVYTKERATDGWALVMADAESTNKEIGPEVFTMGSDKAVNKFPGLPGTGGALPAIRGGSGVINCTDTGWGSLSVTCAGAGTGSYRTKALVGYATAPTTAYIELTTNDYSMQGGAFGISLPNVAINKDVVGRVADTDQFTVAVKSGASPVATATTTDTTVYDPATDTHQATAGPKAVLAGNYTYSETAAGTTNLANYAKTWTCTDASGTTTTAPAFSGGSDSATTSLKGTTTVALGQIITCTVTNTPKPRITLVKELTRNAATDQASVDIKTSSSTLATTTTTGSTVGTKITATTGVVTVSPNTDGTYPALTLSDTMLSNASLYTSSYSCTNATAGGTTVTSGTTTSFSLTPKLNDNITCTFVNTPKPAINITKTVNTVSPVAANGDSTVVYDVKATNTSVTAGTYGPILDTPSFASNLVITKAEWTLAGSNTWTTLSGAAPYTIGTSKTLAGNTTDSYQVRITFHSTTDTAITADTCSATPKAGEGLFNSVTATGETGATTDNQACATITPPKPVIDLDKSVKSITDTNKNGFNDAGDVIQYSFTVTNTGPVTLAPVTISDPLLKLTTMACVASLAPGALATCDATVTYTVTAADVTASKVTNTAVATGTPPYTSADNPPVNSPERSVDTLLAPVGKAIVTKTDAKTGATQNGAVYSLYTATANTWDGSTPTPASSVCRSATTSDKTPIATGLTTSGSGTVTIANLRLSTYDYSAYQPITSGSYLVYCLVETKAPTGYELSAAPTAFVVTSSTTTSAVTVKNVVHNLGNLLPTTGGKGVGAALPGLVLLVGSGLLMLRRRQGRGE